MEDWTRRLELGKIFLDAAKYVGTIVVIGGLVAKQIDVGTILFGIVLSVGLGTIGFLAILPEEKR